MCCSVLATNTTSEELLSMARKDDQKK